MRMRSPILIAGLSAALTCFGISVSAQPAPPANAAAETGKTAAPDPGLSAERLKRLDSLLEKYVDDDQIAGAVALVLRDGKPVYEGAFGWSDKEAGRKMRMDTIFRIASQTKAITSAAILALVEEGKVGITEPVSDFVPTFAKTTVAVKGDGGITMVPAKRPIVIADLLTHTAGISYGTESAVASLYQEKGLGPAAGNGWYTADKDEPICETMERLGTLPFVAQPGESFVYGYNIDILGCVVEKASGMPLDQFIRTRITQPLGMKDTAFFLPAEQRGRLAAVYSGTAGGTIVRAPEGSKGQGHYVDGPRKSFAGGAGLLSTAADYARFLETLRRGGALGGIRILGPRAVELMTTNQTGQLHSAAGLGFGFGFETVDRYGAKGMASVSSFGWGGAYGTTYQVDRLGRLVVVLMIQLMPSHIDLEPKFYNVVYQALVN
jgi:CubicO group peptidase (beta-lactamase class C family)